MSTAYSFSTYGLDIGHLPAVHPAVLPLSLLTKMWGENKMENLLGQDKNREITHQLLSDLKHTHLQELTNIQRYLNIFSPFFFVYIDIYFMSNR